MTRVTTPNGFVLDNSGRRLVVDPVTRIEGHLRCEVNIDQDKVIRNAVSSGTMWRGLEVILKGRDPRDAWAFTERVCGVCTGTHALTSVRAVEDSLGIQIPENANIIRNMMQLTLWTQDHLVHFYHLHALDWVDVIDALKADPKATSALAQSLSPWPNSSPGYYREVQTRLRRFVDSGQLGPFRNGYWGNPAYKLPAEANLMATAHYLEALDFQREIVKIHTVFGGKNPHPNWLVGGVPCAINLDGALAAGAPVNMVQLELVSSIIDRTIAFIDQVYLPDLVAIAGYYKDWRYGGGLSGHNVLSYGDFPDRANDYETSLLVPRGAIVNGDLGAVQDVDLRDPAQIQEFVDHSWYSYPNEAVGLHPWVGITDPDFRLGAKTKGTKTDIRELDESAKYSFIKAPRWRGHAMEVGPLSRFTIGYARGIPEFKEPVDKLLSDLSLPFAALFTTLGRTAARGLEASWAAHKLRYFHDRLMSNLKAGDLATANVAKWEPTTWPRESKGVGFAEAPRGALGHWVHIREGRIEAYQMVVPTTWNGSPRDPHGNIGAFEAALLNTPLADPGQPVEILRTLHSFDPCLACSTHVMGPDGRDLSQITVR
ncbi:hydrogenase 2 large subunit [Acidiferrobacter sp. SPIII_3]|uniref:nickel-dependent hydrogenase large subunit n=1 Tax=Acidiferrobacter sp. SPIII_3 TaxID=1281578 RepID=UPI000D72E0AD|nr:nickel-dependent hydrogenase large subunit [Acidiferrobacter sp. SPIII_3]AWP24003.1 hydrogenase 2 large subunit [Acidiferrobacter sp. SPIII_3]